MGYVATAEVEGNGLAGPVASVRRGSHDVILDVQAYQPEWVSPAGVHTSWDSQCLIHTKSLPRSSDKVPNSKRERLLGMLNHQRLEARCTGPWETALSFPTLPCRKGRLAVGEERGSGVSCDRHAGIGNCTQIRTGTFFFCQPQSPKDNVVPIGLGEAENENCILLSATQKWGTSKGPPFFF